MAREISAGTLTAALAFFGLGTDRRLSPRPRGGYKRCGEGWKRVGRWVVGVGVVGRRRRGEGRKKEGVG